MSTPPDWDPSGFVKIASQRLSKFRTDTLADTFSDAIMLFESSRKGVSSFPSPFRIEVKPLIRRFALTVKGLTASLISARLRFSGAPSLPFLLRTA